MVLDWFFTQNSKHQNRFAVMFVDQIRVHSKAGDGGNGCVSFRREKFVPRGGPNGGDGGKGGDIILRPNVHTDNLVNYYYQPLLKATRGEHGMGKNMYGKAGADAVYKVPVGTLVYRIPAQLLRPPSVEEVEPPKASIAPADCELIADLSQENQELALCLGGSGGKGNTHFKSSTNRAPRQFTEGQPGEEGFFLLELRKIADVRFVGYPNAGKSTLLGRISAAHPKVAPYPFTTLNPVLGVVEFDGYSRATLPDIPGLIPRPHHHLRLAHHFPRPTTPCTLLLFVLDAAGSEGRNPIEDLGNLRRELDLYDPTLSQRPWMIAANKMDLPGAEENLVTIRSRFSDKVIVPMAAAHGVGIEDFKTSLQNLLAL